MEREKCASEQCPISCDQDVYELVAASMMNSAWVLAESLRPKDDIGLILLVQKNNRYPVYAEVYTQTWEGFLGQLGELRDTFQHNHVHIFAPLPTWCRRRGT